MKSQSFLKPVTFAAASLLALASSNAAFAQSDTAEAQPSTPAEEEAEEEGEIVVTATKRAESILDVPIAVTVIDAKSLDQKNATGFADFLTSIPGVQFNPAGNPFGNSISIRGVSDGTSSFLTQQPVALYLDDTALTLSQGAINLDYSVFGVEQINVIKGPNSTLYGASSLGGTIKVITQRPSLTETKGRFKAVVSSTRSSDINYQFAASLTTPLVTDKIGVEATGYYNQAGGTYDDPSRRLENINGKETYGGRLAFRFTPTERLTIDLTGYYQNLDGDGLDTFAPATVGDLQSRPLRVDQFQRDRFALGTLAIDYEFDFADLVSVSSYYDRTTRTNLDFSFSFLNFDFLTGAFRTTPLSTETSAFAEVFSQELRLVSRGSGPFKWLIGGYYSHEDYTEAFISPPIRNLVEGRLNYVYDTYAVFGEVGYDLTDRLNLTFGGRYTRYDTEIDFNSSIFFVPALLQRSDSDNDFSPRIALNYNYGSGSIYAQASRGFRLGQVNVPIVSLPSDNVPAFFQADNLWNYEIGAKTRWGNNVQVNVAAYYIDWQDIQLTRNASTGFSFIDNAGAARIFGFELEATANLTRNTTWTGNFGYINGELTQTVPTVALAGTRLPGSPEFTVSTSLEQRFKLSGKDAFARIDYLYYGEYDNALVFTGPVAVNGGYSKLDLRAGAAIGKIDVSLFLTNLLDERPILTRSDAGGEERTTIQPRTFGGTLGYRF